MITFLQIAQPATNNISHENVLTETHSPKIINTMSVWSLLIWIAQLSMGFDHRTIWVV